MAFYSCVGETEAFSFTIGESWHPAESFFDAQTGNSCVTQLARVANTLRSSLLRSDYPYHRIETDTADTVLASIDYDANPEWNPLLDIRTILFQTFAQVIGSLAPPTTFGDSYYSLYFLGYAANSLCSEDSLYRYIDSATIKANLVGSMVGVSFDRKEDWLLIINALRNALEEIELVSEVVVAPYRTYFGFGPDAENVGTCRINATKIYAELDIEEGQNDPAAIFRTTWDPPPYQTEIRFGNGTSWANYNLWPNRASQCPGSSRTIVDPNPELSGIGGVLGSWFFTRGAILTSPDGAYYAYRVPDPYCSNNQATPLNSNYKAGWYTRKEHRFTVRFEKTFHTSHEVTDEVKNTLTGFETFWSFSATQMQGSFEDVEFTISPGMSGSFVWAEDEHYKDIEFTITLTNPKNWGVNQNYVSVRADFSIDTFQLGLDCDNNLHLCLGEL